MRKNILGLSLFLSACFFLGPQAGRADDASDVMAEALEAQQQTPPVSRLIVPRTPPQVVSETPAPKPPAPPVTPVPETKAAEPVQEKLPPPVPEKKESIPKTEESPAPLPQGSDTELIIADFNTGDKPNNLGGDFGGWDKDPNDDTQGCRATLVSEDASGDMEGFALRLDYDVDSPSPAYNGFWMKLENVNASPYDTLSFYIRGASKRFTKRLKVEFKTPDKRSSSYFISGITENWEKIEIPLERFKGIKSWASVSELILVFDDVNTAPKKGTLLVDHMTFERKEQGMPQVPAQAASPIEEEKPDQKAGA